MYADVLDSGCRPGDENCCWLAASTATPIVEAGCVYSNESITSSVEEGGTDCLAELVLALAQDNKQDGLFVF